MKTAWRSTRVIATAFFVAAAFTACAKTLPPGEPVPPPPPAAAERTGEGGQEEAKKVVVAKVNGVALTMDALVNMMNRLPGKSGAPGETLEERRKRALDSVILLELAWQRAKAQGLGIDPLKIDLAIDNFKNNLGGEAKYAEHLSSRKLTEADLRQEVERSLTIELIYGREVVDKTAVPEEVLKKEYEDNRQRYIQPERVTAIDVHLLRKDDEEARRKAGELLARMKDAGGDPWKLVLDGTFTVRNLLVLKDRDKELYDAAKKLTPHELSGVIDTPSGIHILRLESYSPEKVPTYDEAKALLTLKLKGPYQEKRTQEWEQELKKDAKIEIIEP